jgi:hypothetical protein
LDEVHNSRRNNNGDKRETEENINHKTPSMQVCMCASGRNNDA